MVSETMNGDDNEGVVFHHGGAVAPRPRPRRWVVHVLVVLAAVLLLVTATNVWVKRQMLETDTWVSTSEQLLADPEIRAALSVFLVDELYESVDVAGQLQQQLPDQLAGLAASVAAGLRSTAVDLVDRLLATPEAQQIWSRANQRAHEAFLAVVRDEGLPAAASTADGTVTLDLRAMVIALAERLGLSGSRIERIPEDSGQVVLVQSEQLAELQDVVRLIEWAGIVLFIVIIGLFAAAIVLARGWRRVAIRLVGLAVLIDALLILLALRLAGSYLLENYVAVEANEIAVANVYGIATTLLTNIAWTGVLLGGMTIVATVLVGPAPLAVALRRKVGPTLVANPAATWVAVALGLLALAAWSPLDIITTWFGLVAIVAIVVGTMAAFRWASEHDSTPLILEEGT
jgi:hypothetical protein